MSVQEILRAIEVDAKLHEVETRGARSLESFESRTGREALERLARAELRAKAQTRMSVRGGRP